MPEHRTTRPAAYWRARHKLTVGDLREKLANVPDWAEVTVEFWDELDLPEEVPMLRVDYSRGVLSVILTSENP